eukprot:CAMPEP_0117640678 /NCGR_PEP_ID=MMETSP0802-20121206/8965_1 /TAXON_ID=38833 /ORGANISM="Micromonas sp., Strain CCMP2099" /LENGTH=82 /DNA_ID=CAMNT_0005445647 /DNA_START=253 /DNA_END=501 /DNA_ORIENTATION=-
MTFDSVVSIMACAPDTVGTDTSKETESEACLPTTILGSVSRKSDGVTTISSSSPKCSVVFGPEFLSTHPATTVVAHRRVRLF